MPDLPPSFRLAGEVTERAELLNGAMQLSLDGLTVASEDPWTIEFALSWRLGRAGAVALDEGDLTLELEAAGAEVIAILEEGTAELDPDTGNVEVAAVFEVESTTAVTPAADQLRARLEIGAESWTGELSASSDEGGG